MDYASIRVADASDWQVYHTIRRSSLWEERGLAGYDDARPEERASNFHPLLLKLSNRRIGTTRLDDLYNGRGIVRLVAIAAADRRQGHGRAFSALVENYARRLGITTLFVSAALDAEGFYTATGWMRCTTGAPEQVGHADYCVQMIKALVR